MTHTLGTFSLPDSKRLSIGCLYSLFDSTVTSYKYLFMLSLLSVLERNQYTSVLIPLPTLQTEMLTHAWYPHVYFRLSFGTQDQVASALDSLSLDTEDYPIVLGSEYQAHLRRAIGEQVVKTDLMRFVPYRILRPFFRTELQGEKDSLVNERIKALAEEKFSSTKPLYMFSSTDNAITLHPEWLLYFKENSCILSGFIYWQFLQYMQKRNPNVPNIGAKLLPEFKREPLSFQRSCWEAVLKEVPLSCIYSGARLASTDFSLDHFVPWSFVVHDQLWNLCPTSVSVNSKKSNVLPSLSRYLDSFIDLQYAGIEYWMGTTQANARKKITEEYMTNLHLKSEKEVLDRNIFREALTNVVVPLMRLAENHGFHPDWEWRR